MNIVNQENQPLNQDSSIDCGVSFYCTHTELRVQAEMVSSVTFKVPGIRRGLRLTWNHKSLRLPCIITYSSLQKRRVEGPVVAALLFTVKAHSGEMMPPTGPAGGKALRHSPVGSSDNQSWPIFLQAQKQRKAQQDFQGWYSPGFQNPRNSLGRTHRTSRQLMVATGLSIPDGIASLLLTSLPPPVHPCWPADLHPL